MTNWFSRLFRGGAPATPSILPEDSGDPSMDRNGRPIERLPESPEDETNPELQHLVNRINSGSRMAYTPADSAPVAAAAASEPVKPRESNVFHESALVQRHPWASPAEDSPTSVVSEATHFVHQEIPFPRQSLRAGFDDASTPTAPVDDVPLHYAEAEQEEWETAPEADQPEPREPIVAEEPSQLRPLSFQQLSSNDEEELEYQPVQEPEPVHGGWERAEDNWEYAPEAPAVAEDPYPATPSSAQYVSHVQHPADHEPVTATTGHYEEEWESSREEWAPASSRPEPVYEASIAEEEPRLAEPERGVQSPRFYDESADLESAHPYEERAELEPARQYEAIAEPEPARFREERVEPEPVRQYEEQTEPEPERAHVHEYPRHDLEPSTGTWESAHEDHPAAAVESSPEEPLQTSSFEPETVHSEEEFVAATTESLPDTPEDEAEAEAFHWQTHATPAELEVGESVSLAPDELEAVSDVVRPHTHQPVETPQPFEVRRFDAAAPQYTARIANLPDPYSDPVGARPGRLDRNPPPHGRLPQAVYEELETAHASRTATPMDLAPADVAPVVVPSVVGADAIPASSPAKPESERSADSMFFPPATRSQRLARRAAEVQATRSATEASPPAAPDAPRLSRRWALLSQFGPVTGGPVLTDPGPGQRRSHYKIVDTNHPSDD